MNGAVTRASVPGGSRQSAEFFNIAKAISGDIANTYTKLEKLTLLCRRKTIFDDKPVEIQELTYIIKHDIASLNKQIGQLQNISKAQRTAQGHHAGSVLAMEDDLSGSGGGDAIIDMGGAMG